MKKLMLLFAALAGLAGVMLAQSTNPDVKIKKVPVTSTPANSGSEMFRAYCAACHGATGVGDGPAAPALKTAPTNLTTLAATNDGKFPVFKIQNILLGKAMTPSHGSSDMPTWGPLFRSMNSHDENIEQLRVHNLTEYIKSLQK